MKSLPKDLEAKRDELRVTLIKDNIDDPIIQVSIRSLEKGMVAVLEHEMIKKLEEAFKKIRDTIEFGQYFGTEATNMVVEADKALAEFRAWKEGK